MPTSYESIPERPITSIIINKVKNGFQVSPYPYPGGDISGYLEVYPNLNKLCKAIKAKFEDPSARLRRITSNRTATEASLLPQRSIHDMLSDPYSTGLRATETI